MKITNVSFSELNNFKAGDPAPNIASVYEQIDSYMPENLKREFEFRRVKLDFYHDGLDAENTIPYYFGAPEASEELEQYLKQFVILVHWIKA